MTILNPSHRNASSSASFSRLALGTGLALGVSAALADYIARADSASDDVRFADRVLARIAEGAPTYTHEEVWADIEQRKAAGELPDQVLEPAAALFFHLLRPRV